MKITFIKYLFIRNSMFFLQKISLKVLLGYVDILNGVVIMIRSNGAHSFFLRVPVHILFTSTFITFSYLLA